MAKTKKKKGVKRVLAVILCIVILAIVGLGSAWATGWAITGEANPAKWGNTTKSVGEPRTVAISSEGELMKDGSTYAMPANFMFLPARISNASYAAEGEVTVSARLSNQYINGKFDWTAEFTDPTSEWAQYKSANAYVSVEPIADGVTAKIKFLAKFGEQITITATLRGSEQSDSCTVDCLKTVKIITSTLGGEDFGETTNIDSEITYDTGTVEGQLEFSSARLALSEDFKTLLKSYLKFDLSVMAFSFNETQYMETFTVNGKSYITIEGDELNYSMFVGEFNAYDDEHKDAIYYAWNRAFSDAQTASGDKLNYRNVLIDVEYTYTINGYQAADVNESDYLGGRITGYTAADGVLPSVYVNQDIIF